VKKAKWPLRTVNCKVEGCTREVRARGMCNVHYNAAWARGEFGKKHSEAVKAGKRRAAEKRNGAAEVAERVDSRGSTLRSYTVSVINDLAMRAFVGGDDAAATALRDLGKSLKAG
jgi:hypothetical protein